MLPNSGMASLPARHSYSSPYYPRCSSPEGRSSSTASRIAPQSPKWTRSTSRTSTATHPAERAPPYVPRGKIQTIMLINTRREATITTLSHPASTQTGDLAPSSRRLPAILELLVNVRPRQRPRSCSSPQQRKAPGANRGPRIKLKEEWATTYSPTERPCSTIHAGGLNFSVRNGKRCIPTAIVTLSKGSAYSIVKRPKHV